MEQRASAVANIYTVACWSLELLRDCGWQCPVPKRRNKQTELVVTSNTVLSTTATKAWWMTASNGREQRRCPEVFIERTRNRLVSVLVERAGVGFVTDGDPSPTALGCTGGARPSRREAAPLPLHPPAAVKQGRPSPSRL